MARHVKIVSSEAFDGNVETDAATTLAKKIFDVVNGNTFIGMTAVKQGQHTAVIIVYDAA